MPAALTMTPLRSVQMPVAPPHQTTHAAPGHPGGLVGDPHLARMWGCPVQVSSPPGLLPGRLSAVGGPDCAVTAALPFER